MQQYTDISDMSSRTSSLSTVKNNNRSRKSKTRYRKGANFDTSLQPIVEELEYESSYDWAIRKPFTFLRRQGKGTLLKPLCKKEKSLGDCWTEGDFAKVLGSTKPNLPKLGDCWTEEDFAKVLGPITKSDLSQLTNYKKPNNTPKNVRKRLIQNEPLKSFGDCWKPEDFAKVLGEQIPQDEPMKSLGDCWKPEDFAKVLGEQIPQDEPMKSLGDCWKPEDFAKVLNDYELYELMEVMYDV